MYIVKENDWLKKYQVNTNIEKLKEIRNTLFEECKIIYHVSDLCWCYGKGSATKIVDDEPLFWSRVKNYVPKTCVSHGKYEFDHEEYILEYDFCEVPKIIELLDEVIGDIEYEISYYRYYPDSNLLKENKELCAYKRLHKYDTNLDEVIYKLINYNDFGYSNNINKFTDSKQLTKIYEPSIDKQRLIKEYIRRIKECIVITLVDVLDYNTYVNLTKFLDNEVKDLKDKQVLKYI